MQTSKHVTTNDGIFVFEMKSDFLTVMCTNYGCTIMQILMPDKNGTVANIVAGFDKPEKYFDDHPYLGCIIGRYANRIADGKFKIDESEYKLPVNNFPNHLHGGFNGFDKKIWCVEKITNTANYTAVTFNYISEDGEEGYPGSVNVKVTYTLNDRNEFITEYSATTNKATIINLTNHSYFNLSGFQQETIYDHWLSVKANFYTSKNSDGIPTGSYIPVAGTSMDFTLLSKIGEAISSLKNAYGFDDNYVLNKNDEAIYTAAVLYHQQSGRKLIMRTNKPGMQLYTANWWDGSILNEQNIPLLRHGAVALETQFFPDSPNQPNFPNTILRPGELYKFTTIYHFTVE